MKKWRLIILYNILIAPTTFAQYTVVPLNLLEKNNIDLLKNNYGQKLSITQLVKLGRNCNGVIAGTELYTKEVLEQLPNLKVISRLGVGLDNIDWDAAKKKGIKLYKTHTTPAPAVAELVLGLMLDLARKITHHNNTLKSGKWKKAMGSLLHGKTLGIIGLGTIVENW